MLFILISNCAIDCRPIERNTIVAYKALEAKLKKKLQKLADKLQTDSTMTDISVVDAWRQLITTDSMSSVLKQTLGRDHDALLNGTLSYFGGYNNSDEKKLSTAYLFDGGTV